MFRQRSRTLGRTTSGHYDSYIFGTIYAGTSYAFGGTVQTGLEQCDDSTQPPPYDTDQNLDLTKRTVVPLRMSGSWYPPGYYRYVYSNYGSIARTSYVYCPGTTLLNWGGLVNKALANLNPNKPILDLPLFLFEFKDFPGMLRDLGRVLQRKVHPADIPNGYLAYSFGWRPLMSDLQTLFDLSKQLDQRIRYLTDAKNLSKGVRYRRTLGSETSHSSAGQYVEGPFTATEHTTVTTKAWMSGHVRVTSDLPPPRDLPRFIVENGLGASLSASTLWEATPWSWLIDYFASIGDALQATRGFIHWEAPNMCVMQRSEAVSKLEGASASGGITHNAGEHHMTTVSKRRNVYVAPLVSISPSPFLTNGHLANLGALLLSRALKG